MALYETFSSVPVNRAARARLLRAARLGTRAVAVEVDYGDAARCVDSARAYKEGWQTSSDPFPVTVRTSWAAR